MSDQDFVDEVINLHTGATVDFEAINNVLGDVDTAEFDSDVLVMPVPVALLCARRTSSTASRPSATR